MIRNSLGAVALAAVLAVSAPAAAGQSPLHFKLIDTGGAAPGTIAYQAFSAAANYWSSVLTTSQPVTVNVQVGFQPIGDSVLGFTSTNTGVADIASTEFLMGTHQFGAFDATAVAGLPPLHDGAFGPATALDVHTPGYTDPVARTGINNGYSVLDTDGSANNSFVVLTVANARALGFDVGDPNQIDASIVLSSQIPFDFNPGNGITPGDWDFVGTAIHEMGHALGFYSGVDLYDAYGTGGAFAGFDCGGVLCQDLPANDYVWGYALDLFRYSAPGALDWTPGSPDYFSVDGGHSAYLGGLFSTGFYNGDGFQAGHWKAPFVCDPSQYLGAMNPYLCVGEQGAVSGLDLAALDSIGWNVRPGVGDYAAYHFSTANISVPEPQSWLIMVFGLGLIGGALRSACGRRGTRAGAPA
jgi:hypothetical protein